MEVHHHSHSERKKWTHYFWEFFMLFLAVFCGFLAENQREHFIENLRAKHYAKTLLNDLIEDTIEINNMRQECYAVLNAIDSISSQVQQGFPENKSRGSFYYFSRIASIVPLINWHKATLTQVIQSGNLRYFTNKELVDRISYYYAMASEIDRQQDTDKKFREQAVSIRNKIVNNRIFTRYSAYNITTHVQDSDLVIQVKIMQNDPLLLNEYANSFENRKATLKNLTTYFFPQQLKIAGELIYLLKSAYHID